MEPRGIAAALARRVLIGAAELQRVRVEGGERLGLSSSKPTRRPLPTLAPPPSMGPSTAKALFPNWR